MEKIPHWVWWALAGVVVLLYLKSRGNASAAGGLDSNTAAVDQAQIQADTAATQAKASALGSLVPAITGLLASQAQDAAALQSNELAAETSITNTETEANAAITSSRTQASVAKTQSNNGLLAAFLGAAGAVVGAVINKGSTSTARPPASSMPTFGASGPTSYAFNGLNAATFLGWH